MASSASGPLISISSRAAHFGTQSYQIEYALSIGRTAFAADPNLGLERLYELYQSAGSPRWRPSPLEIFTRSWLKPCMISHPPLLP